MPDVQRQVAITRVAYLELREERLLAQEGYGLLDEKRILLAAEIRRQMAALRELRNRFDETHAEAREAFKSAVRQHGFDDVSVWPSVFNTSGDLSSRRRRLLGLELLQSSWTPAAAEQEQPRHYSPEIRACARAFRPLIGLAVELAALTLNLRRLAREYARTERRARAIENVLLPEIETLIKYIEEQLEGTDQEEIVRLRWIGRRDT